MKKVLLIVFGSIAAAGLVLGIIGFALGGWFGSVIFNRGHIVYSDRGNQVELADAPWWMRNWKGTWQLFGFSGAEPVNGWDDWQYNESDAAAVNESFDAPFTQAGSEAKVDIEIDAGYLTVQTGNEWSLEVRGPLKTTSEVEDGVWTLRSKTNLDNIRTSSDNWDSRPRFYRNGVDVTTDYILTVPAEMGQMDASLSMGVMTVDGLDIDSAGLTLNLGLMKVMDCTADSADLTVDLGAAEVTNFVARECNLNVNLGSIEYEGNVTERLNANCDLGAINCTLEEPEAYGYDLEVGLGAISIDGREQATFSGTNRSEGQNLKPFYDLDCDLGAIEIIFA